jgi:hypothetical protein
MALQAQEPAYAQRWMNPDAEGLDESVLDLDMSLVQSPLTFYDGVLYGGVPYDGVL